MPLRLVSFCSFGFIIFAIVLGIQTLIRYFSGSSVEGFTTVIIVMLLVGGVLAGALGIIGEYVARIFEELKKRPSYILKEVTKDNA